MKDFRYIYTCILLSMLSIIIYNYIAGEEDEDFIHASHAHDEPVMQSCPVYMHLRIIQNEQHLATKNWDNFCRIFNTFICLKTKWNKFGTLEIYVTRVCYKEGPEL
jgi:hypothetical protein